MHLATMSTPERLIRGLAGAALIALYVMHPNSTWALVGIIPLVTALLNFCPMYALCRRQQVAAEGPADGRADSTHMERPPPLEPTAREALAEEADTPEPVLSEDGLESLQPPRKAGSQRNRTKRGRKKARSRAGGAAPRSGAKTAAAVASGKIVHATDASFEKLVLTSEQPVLVDFWAEWCGPCKAIAPVLEQLAGEYAGRARIVKVDVDHCPAVAAEFNIRSIPTLALFRDGEVADVVVGAQGKAKLSKMLDRAL